MPGLFEPFNSDNDSPNSTNRAIDEWTLCEALGDDMADTIENHYKTFIVSEAFEARIQHQLNFMPPRRPKRTLHKSLAPA